MSDNNRQLVRTYSLTVEHEAKLREIAASRSLGLSELLRRLIDAEYVRFAKEKK